MKVRKKKRRKPAIVRILTHPVGKVMLSVTAIAITLGLITLSYFYLHYARITDEKLAAGPIGNTAMLFASPRQVSLGDESTIEDIVAQLRKSGYSEFRGNRLGWYNVRVDAVEIFPGKDSRFPDEAAVIRFSRGRISEIISLGDNTKRIQYELEPELITNLFDRNREKRRLVHYSDMPKHLVNAVLAAEDKHFFQHSGFDPLRVLKSAYVNWKAGSIQQGFSTLSMQFAGDIWLDRSKRTYSRKAAEVLITLHLERKLTKEQIFEFYANQIYLGQIGSFAIHGYGQAAQAYFNKDVGTISLAEAALLAGLPRGPSWYNPFRNPERAKQRRQWVLGQMLELEMITEEEYAAASETPLEVTTGGTEVGDAPYFVDLVNGWLRQQFNEYDFQSNSYRVYTSMDMNLQKEAMEAVRIGLEEVDKRCLSLGRTPENGWPKAQVAMVVLDPKTGAVKALVGGRRYSASQLNRAVADRPPGSVFKPFVYAAALNTAVEGGPLLMTTLTELMDEPTTFWYDDKPYEPEGYKDTYYGKISLRRALAKSLNVPTVKVAEMVGYDKVVDIAQRAGLNMNIMPTPSVALGSYDVTPLEMAGAYTMFANQGEVVKPYSIQMIRDQDDRVLYENHSQSRPVLDARVAYLIVNLMEEVLKTGTGIRVRLNGFSLPAAGKTGTSHDGWFAGFTSELLCVVWVGYDDYRDVQLEGAETALPIWTEFMKRAHAYPQYRRVKPFEPPDGIITMDIDPPTGKLAATGCGADPQPEVFIAGTQPLELCDGRATQVAGWALPSEEPELMVSRAPNQRKVDSSNADGFKAPQVNEPPQEETPNKKGIFGRFLDIFR